jgi:D-3-phosphoglycerate dehydrogenase
VYIVSGGFREYIIPVAETLGIRPDHVLANSFSFDGKGRVIGIDEQNVLAQKAGKAKAVKSLGLNGEIFIIGDGFTDLEIKQHLTDSTFVAYTETVFRENVVDKADYSVPNFDEFLYKYDLPRLHSYPKNRISVLLLENIHQKAVQAFEKEGYAVEYLEKSLAKEELIKRIERVNILGIRSKTRIDTEILENAKKILAIGAFCIGTDQINLTESGKKGVAVFNAPFSNTRSVVELVLGEIIMLARGIPEKNLKMHQGVWDKSAAGAYELRGKTLGIIGYGNIGTQLSVLSEALGMQVLFYDVVEKLPLGTARQVASLKELLAKADIVTVHVDGNKGNTDLIGEKEFSQMKDGVVFLNLSRGFVVNMDALVMFLKNGKIRGAAIDVFPTEPEGKGDPLISPLQEFSNVILTPHIGGSTAEAQEGIGEFVSTKIIDYMNTGSTYMNVSLPQVQLPSLQRSHRLLHIHKNVPGVLATINQTLAENKLNITGQYLKTQGEIGYVITDVNKQYDKRVLQDLHTFEGTIKFRVLY